MQSGIGADQNIVVKKALGNEFATICWGSIALLSVVFSLYSSDMGPRKTKKNSQQLELEIQRLLGKMMANKITKEFRKDFNALVINQITGEKSKEFHNAFMTGFKSGQSGRAKNTFEEIINLERNGVNKDRQISEALIFTEERFDTIIAKYSDVAAVISLVGVPSDFESCQAWVKANNGELFIEILTDDPFWLGGMLVNREIVGCVIPKRLYEYSSTASERETPEKIFQARYWYVNSDNIIQTMRKDGRIFRVTQRF